MLLILIFRLSLPSKEKTSEHLLSAGWLWYDTGADTGNNKDFMGFTDPINAGGGDSYFFSKCKNRNLGPDRTVIALAPSGNSIITNIKTRLDADLASYGLTTQLYSSRDAIMDVIGGEDYEKDGNPGICFGAALVESDDSAK